MRLIKIVPAALLAVAVVSGAALAAIDNSDHDLRVRLEINQICLPCHAPHHAINADEGPIWNHEITEEAFTRHDEAVTLGESSKLCLSCHDGVTAVGNFGAVTSANDPVTGGAAIGTDLTDDHPIGIEYPLESHTMYPPADVSRYLEDGKVECGSCHYAHSSGQDGKFLRKTIVNSELCGVCHTFKAPPPPPEPEPEEPA